MMIGVCRRLDHRSPLNLWLPTHPDAHRDGWAGIKSGANPSDPPEEVATPV
jgi:hypothetical protein